jgi:HD-GYP domain-containing protein (c-di-GMP phosphodiesterase class II)
VKDDSAAAFLAILRKEFAAPFVLHDAATGLPAGGERPTDERFVSGAGESVRDWFAPAAIKKVAADGRGVARSLAGARYLLQMCLFQGGRVVFVASGVFTGVAHTTAEADRECAGLARWVQSFSDRLRLADQMAGQRHAAEDGAAQAKAAWEGLLALEQVMRRVRVHRDPARNRQRVLDAVFGLLGVQTLVCVPPDGQAGVCVVGEPLLAPLDFVQLAGLLAKAPAGQAGAIFCNSPETQPWSLSFPAVSNLMAFPVCEHDAPGWVIAVNKFKGGAAASREVVPFRRSDAALLIPFVALLRLHYGAATRYQDLKELMVGLARSLTAAIDAKDSFTFGHSERVARIGVELGKALGMAGDALNDIYLAGLLHDVGKIGVPDDLLRREDDLTDEEHQQVQQHVSVGYTILADLRPIRHLLPGILHHHERMDGRGYPEQLAGDAIPLLARVLAVADAYDAMSTHRPFRTALTFSEVERRLQEGSGTQWDPQVVDAFLRVRHKIHAIRQRGVGESLRQALDGALRSDGSTTRI